MKDSIVWIICVQIYFGIKLGKSQFHEFGQVYEDTIKLYLLFNKLYSD